MNMKKIYYSISLLFLILNLSCNRIVAQNSLPNRQIEKRLRNFYTNYINEIANPHMNISKIDSIRIEYCTKAFLKKYCNAKLLFDPLLNAQIADIVMLKTLKIEGDKESQNIYYVSYIYGNWLETIKLQISQEEDEYKIDNVFLKEYKEEQITK
jgi:hypothetical protein